MFAYTLFSFFLQCIKVFLTCLRLITLVLAIPRSKKNAFALLGPNYTVLSLSALHKGFRPFAAYHAASRYISLIRTFFRCCGATLRCVQLFRTGNGFCLFGANRAVLSCFGSLLPYFQLFCTWKRFSPVFFFWCLITLLSALSHGKDFSLSCRWI